MFMISKAKYHIYISSVTVTIAKKPEAEEFFRTAAMLLF
jgi:hypothetical protein